MEQAVDGAMTTRTIFDEKSENGLVLAGKYMPEELQAEILCHVDYKSLLNCQLVCKRWRILIQSYVWRKKAEVTLGRLLLVDKDAHWHIYYLMCKKKPFERNFIKNSSGEHGQKKYWTIISDGGDGWTVENPPVGVPPLPTNDPVLAGKQFCFATSYRTSLKVQRIDLEAEGLTPYVLDNWQPPIVVSEWYSCRWDCPAAYNCSIKLLDQNDKTIDKFQFIDTLEGEKQNKWHQVMHEFTNYGPGLRTISFYHGGMDHSFWAGHYGSKMAGASVYMKIPTARHCDDEDSNSLLNMD